jgi:hypothetical protein
MAPNKVLQMMFGPFRAPPATEPKHWASSSSSHCGDELYLVSWQACTTRERAFAGRLAEVPR